MVMVSPADSSLILEGSEERRRYMNSVISQYNRQYLDDVIQYNKALSQRNRILKDFARNHFFEEDLLTFWDEKLADTGTRIHLRRKEFLSELMPVFQRYYQTISGGHESVELTYQSQLDTASMQELLSASRERDCLLQFTTSGIHRDDLLLELSGYPMKQQGSQGQQKTYLIALKMAQYDFLKQVSDVRPLILLDDVFDKLDSDRVTQIMKLVAADHFGQIFITDTNQDHLEKILATIPVEYKLFRIEDEQVLSV
jgi:DNA replication and repair protein RecF